VPEVRTTKNVLITSRTINLFAIICLGLALVAPKVEAKLSNQSDVSSPFKLPFNAGLEKSNDANLNSVSQFDAIHAKNYLISQYNPTIGLIRENVYLDRYWLWSDNALAAQVLKGYDDSISQNVDDTIDGYMLKYNLRFISPYKLLLDEPNGTPSFRPPIDGNLVDSVWYTNYIGGDLELSCRNYADIAFLKSIYFYKNNDFRDSKACYHQGVNMFDGVGFKDKSFYADGNLYSTYKVALWKIASKITGFGRTHEIINLMGILQDPLTGGIYTHYNAALTPKGHANVETTSLVIMGYSV
jgi:hypothetical protein